jgi:hypothetical protein
MIEWKPHTIGEKGYLGKFKVFSVFLDGGQPMGSTRPYLLACNLPGIKTGIGHYATEEEGKDRAEVVLEHWLKGAGIRAIKKADEEHGE